MVINLITSHLIQLVEIDLLITWLLVAERPAAHHLIIGCWTTSGTSFHKYSDREKVQQYIGIIQKCERNSTTGATTFDCHAESMDRCVGNHNIVYLLIYECSLTWKKCGTLQHVDDDKVFHIKTLSNWKGSPYP